jgi:hypothetical protein
MNKFTEALNKTFIHVSQFFTFFCIGYFLMFAYNFGLDFESCNLDMIRSLSLFSSVVFGFVIGFPLKFFYELYKVHSINKVA